jgi:hypothetical protein
MKSLTYVSMTLTEVFLAALCTAAQNNPGNILAAEFQTPKPGMTRQYAQGRKQKAEWHKQHNDPHPLCVSQIVSREGTGTYLVTRGGQHWADMDHPTIPDAADDQEYDKVASPLVASLVDSCYEFLPKLSNSDTSTTPSVHTGLLVLGIKFGKDGDFRSAVERIADAERKANPSAWAGVHQLANGGFTGTFVVAVPRSRWADFEHSPSTKPMAQVLTEAYGPDAMSSILTTLDNSVESEYSEMLKFRQDSSYIPAK